MKLVPHLLTAGIEEDKAYSLSI